MKDPVFDTIAQAIDTHRLLEVRDEAGKRLIEPYLVFESAKGDLLLHGWQRSGAFRAEPPPRWCNLHLDDIVEAEIAPGRFAQPHPDYNPTGPQFHRVVYLLDERGPRTLTKSSGVQRLARKRRRGPPTGRNGRIPKLRQPRQRPDL